MRYAEAFEKLGYRLRSPRRDWSADSEKGVCLSIWQKELESDASRLWMDTTKHASEIEQWKDKPGNRLRIQHLSHALDKFDGWIDVVLVSGTPGEGFDDAAPWIPEKRMGKRWRVLWLDSATGHFEVEMKKF